MGAAEALLLVAGPPLEVEDREPVTASVLAVLSSEDPDVDVSITGRQVYS